MFKDFKYKEGDIVMFPDTESEYVDVEIGYVKVAEIHISTVCEVVSIDNKLALRIIDNNYSETFRTSGVVTLKKYLDYFGNWDNLVLISEKN